MKRTVLSLICLALVGVSLRGCVRREEIMLTKEWNTKADFEAGTLNNVLVPEGTNRLELKRKALSGTGVWIFDGGAGRKFNWQSFEHTKDNTKTILRDDFRENSLDDYNIDFIDCAFMDNGLKEPFWDSANKRVGFIGADEYGFVLRPDVTVQNFMLSFDFLATGTYPSHAVFITAGRWVDNRNMYTVRVDKPAPSEAHGSPIWDKIINGSIYEIARKEIRFSLNTQYQMITTINGNSLEVEVPGLASLSTTDSQWPNAGGAAFGSYQADGWIDNFLLEHYSLPSPSNCSVSFKFWASNDEANWGSEYTDITKVPTSRFIKIQATLARTSLLSAMPTLEDMTLGYKLLVQPIFI